MKGVYNKKAISCIVDPLKAISSVLNGKGVHIVFENSDDSIFISIVNPMKSVYAMYELEASKVITDYEASIKEIAIWDVKNFIDILGKYQNEIYVEDVVISGDESPILITCAEETTDFHLSDISLLADSHCRFKRLKTETLTEACIFDMEGIQIKKLLNNISVYTDLDQLTLSGVEGTNEIKVKLASSSGSIYTKVHTKIENIEVKKDFEMDFPKDDIKGLLGCNDKLQFTVYIGKKNIIQATYSKDNYKMLFYFVPLSVY